MLLELDVTKMAISTTSDEPEGLTFTGTPGSVLAGKREGSTDPAKRSYPSVDDDRPAVTRTR